MRFKLSVLTVLRSPLKAVVTFVLLVATAFAAVGRGMEFIATEQMIDYAEARYTAVGTLVATEDGFVRHNGEDIVLGYEDRLGDGAGEAMSYAAPLDAEALELVLNSGFIGEYEIRNVAGGLTADDVRSFYEEPIVYTNDEYLMGFNMSGVCAIITCHTNPYYISSYTGEPLRTNDILFTVEELIVGDPERYKVGVAPDYYRDEHGMPWKLYQHTPTIDTQTGEVGMYAQFVEGHRYLVVLCDRVNGVMQGQNTLTIAGFILMGIEPWIDHRIIDLTLLEQELGRAVTADDYAYLVEQEYVGIVDRNQHRQDVVYTTDMSLLPRFHDGELYISQGRELTDADSGALENCCGFMVETPDGKIWIPGDSRRMQAHYELDAPDAILFDFSDNDWHIGLQNAIDLANHYPNADLILSHWGTVDAPEMDPFNADPQDLYGKVANPERIRVLAPGEAFALTR